MSETNGTKKETRELVSISIVPYPDWTGRTANSDKRFGDGVHKYGITVPIPTTDEEALELYGLKIEDLVAAGVAQKWYAARDVDNIIDENFAKGRTYDKEAKAWKITNPSALVDPNNEDLVALITDAAEGQRFSAREKTSVARELKILKSGLAEIGMSFAEALAQLKKMKAQA